MTESVVDPFKAEKKEIDPRNLMREAYTIDGIDIYECRSIFLDWALGWPLDTDTRPYVERLLLVYGTDAPDHPMSQVLKASLVAAPTAKRRGGRKGRVAE